MKNITPMKATKVLFVLLLISFAVVSCSDDYSSNGNSNNSASENTSAGDVATFDVAFNTATLDETETIDENDDDYVANTAFADTIRIAFSDSNGATVSGDDNGYVAISGNDVVATNTSANVILYVLSGSTTDGYFKLYSDKKSGIKLNGVNIYNPEGAAINNQSGKRTFIILADGTENYITDGTTYSESGDEDMKGAFFSEGQLVFSGSGYLEVDGNCKAGIRSDDYVRFMPNTNVYVDASAGNGIKGNDGVIITGGVINVNITGTAEKGISSDGYVQIDGGRTTVITSGGYEWDDDESDYTACAGIKADSLFTMNGGTLCLKSTGTGGKGISGDDQLIVNGGTIKIVTTGKCYPENDENATYSTSPKGIKCDGNITINNGYIEVRSSYSEGIESKGYMYIYGGDVESYCYDDAINSKYDLVISGGFVYAHSTNNDGIDSNGDLTISGGVVIAEGASGAECGIDAAEGYSVYINGGTVIALGGSIAATAASSAQASVSSTVTTGTDIALCDDNTVILAYEVPSGSSSGLMISAPQLEDGSTYQLRTGVTLDGGDNFYGLVTGCTVTDGSSTSLEASYEIANSVGGGNPGGGNPGGGHP